MLEHRTRLEGLPSVTVAVLAVGLVAWALSGLEDPAVRAAGGADTLLASPGLGLSVESAAGEVEDPFEPRSLIAGLAVEVVRARREVEAAHAKEPQADPGESPGPTAGSGELVWIERGVVRAEGEVGDLGPEGEWSFWHPNGRRAAQGLFVAGLPGGPWTWWDDGGHVRATGSFEEGQPMGRWQSWHPSGALGVETTFTGGLEHGALLRFFPDGTPRTRGRHARGKRTQRWVTWYPGGGKRSEGGYENGLRQGDWVQWHRNGALKQSAHFERGRPHGAWNEWYSTGQVREAGTFDAGLREGWWEFYLADGTADRRTGSYASGRRVRN